MEKSDRLPAAPVSSARARVLLAVKVLVTAGALGLTFSRLSPADLASAVLRLSPGVVLLATLLTLVNLAVAAVRWRVLFVAHGAPRVPALAFLARAQLVGQFYNVFVPGNVTGDVLRAHATRDAFDGPLGSYMIVALERFFGLAGLFTLGAAALLFRPLPGVARAEVLAAFAFATALAIGVAPLVARALGGRLPGRAGRWAANLPPLARPGMLALALALSVATHTFVALTGHSLVHAVAPGVLVTESLVLVPLAMIATYVPFSVAGLGVREAAFVFLFGKVGVSGADATAASLALMAVTMIVAGLGGLVHLLRPLRVEIDPGALAGDA
jgi:uncharacterized membrane protein YbhN (UPF0104 family)